MMGAFKAYDVRGIWNEDFNTGTVYRIGYFLPSLLKADAVLVGRDVRLSSNEIFKALTDGITDSGKDVIDIGLATTPMVYWATVKTGVDASVQITASHNPPKYNGLKISRKNAIPVGGDSGLKELEELVKGGKVEKAKTKGKIIHRPDVRGMYIDYQKQFVPDLKNLKIAMDLSNGMSNIVIKDVLEGANASYICDELDGRFPNHEPNPLEVKNCQMIMEKTKAENADVGVIYDGDADRVMFIDEKGRFIQPDYITAVLGSYFKNKGRTGNALQDVRTSKSTTEYLEKLGFKVTTWKVGHAYAKTKIRELKAVFGGELAGHYYFQDFFNCDSGVLASLLVLSVVSDLKKEGKPFSSLIDEIVSYRNSGEVNFRLEWKDDAIKALYERFAVREKPDKILDFDGYRIEFPTWWFSVRKSNTEPYLRIVCEARTEKELDERFGEISKIIKGYS